METVIVFRLAAQSFALPIHQIREIVITPALTPLPLAPPYYCGVANVRGKVLAILDLAVRFGIQEAGKADLSRSYTLVVEHPTHALGFRVQEIPFTLNVTEEQVEFAPHFAQDPLMQYCHALIKREEGLIVWLDLPKILDAEKL